MKHTAVYVQATSAIMQMAASKYASDVFIVVQNNVSINERLISVLGHTPSLQRGHVTV